MTLGVRHQERRRKSMRRSIIIVSVIIAVAVVAAIALIEKNRNTKLSRQSESEHQDVSARERSRSASQGKTGEPAIEEVARKTEAEERRAEAEARVAELKAELTAVRAAQSTVSKDPSSASPEVPSMAAIAEMLKNPAMRDMIKAQQKATMEITYGSLLRYLKMEMEPEKLEAFKALLSEKQMALMDAGLNTIGKTLSAQERKEAADSAQQTKEEYDNKIRSFLGEEDYEVYNQYEETQPERMAVFLFKQTLGRDEQLSEQQEHELILAMHDERNKFPFSTGLDREETFDPSLLTAEAITTHLDELLELQEKYKTRAQALLTETQMNQFGQSLTQQNAMQEMGLRMSAQMYTIPSQPETN
jgi:hypothetical protein